MENIVPRWLTEADCWCVGGPTKCQNVDLSILDPILEKFWTTRNLYINNSSQFGPKRDFGPFLTVGSYQSFHDLWSNIMFFIITATNIYQEQAEKQKRCILGAKT